MEIQTIRWYNARLVQYYADITIGKLAKTLERDQSLVGKWFNKKSFRKIIGDQTARHIENTFTALIIGVSHNFTAKDWLDCQHEKEWENRLNIKLIKLPLIDYQRQDSDSFSRPELLSGLDAMAKILHQKCGIEPSRFLEFSMLSIELNSNNVELQTLAATQILEYTDITDIPNKLNTGELKSLSTH